MSQMVENAASSNAEFRERDEFLYKPVPPLAPVTMVIAICALSGLISVLGLGLALVGVCTGAICLNQIRKSEGEFGGKILTISGLSLSILLLCGGSTLHAYVFATEVPEGYQRVSFLHDISMKAPIVEDGKAKIHPEVTDLNGKKIFLKGFVYPTRQTEDLTEFVLVKDSEKCCFGGQPAQTDMILVKMEPNLTINYLEGLVSVAGEFKSGRAQRAGDLAPIYELKGAYYSQAKTNYR